MSGQNAEHREKETSEKKYWKLLLSSFQTTNSTPTSGSIFADWIEQVEKTKFELELIKNRPCFLDVHGKNTSNLVSSKIKFW